METFRCPFCPSKYINKIALYNHIEKDHVIQLQGLSPAQIYFNYKYKKTSGKCIVCGKPTKFNESTERYERIDSEKCKVRYREIFKERMIKKYNKETLLNDPEIQKKMLANRKISGVYKWSKGDYKFVYTGSYEKDFLEFLDIFMNLEPSDIFAPAPQIFEYKYNGKKHFYIPDFYIQSLNLLIEIKASNNNHYRLRDIEIEKIKDSIINKTSYNYFKVMDKKYDDFFDYLIKLKNK